jgi:ParB family chromosome partitioning protein
MSEIISIPLNKLVRSPRNVRKTGGESVEELAASIHAHGLLHNLTVTEHQNQKGAKSGKYEVIAGDRRFRALERLASEKKISKTFDVPCKLIEASAALEASLAENTIRVAMHPADQFIAFHDLVKSGLSSDEVAARFGVSVLFVRQRLKLANVAPRFIEDYRAGAVQLEQLEALALTDDHAAQERVWDSAQNWERSPHNLRRLLTEKKVSSSDKRAIFVSVKAYSDAGGAIERDLFDEENEGYLTDPALLDRPAGDRCEKIVADLLAQGWAWAKPYLENNYWEILDKHRRLSAVQVNLSKELAEEEGKLQTELDAIDDDGSADSEKRIRQIQARLDEIEEARTEFTPEQKAKSGVIFAIDHDGRPTYNYGLVERRSKATKDSEGEGQTQDSAPEEEGSGFSAALLEDLTVQRTAALRAELAGKPNVALVAVTHNLASQVFYDGEQIYNLATGLTIRAEPYTDRVDLRSADESTAAKSLSKQAKAIRKSLPAKIEDLWEWLLGQPQNVLLNVLAVAAAHTVNAVQRPHDPPDCGRLNGAKALAQALELDMANWWQASAANYFGRVKKDQIVEAIQEATGAQVDEKLKSLKKKDLAAEAEKYISSTRWLPEPLR